MCTSTGTAEARRDYPALAWKNGPARANAGNGSNRKRSDYQLIEQKRRKYSNSMEVAQHQWGTRMYIVRDGMKSSFNCVNYYVFYP